MHAQARHRHTPKRSARKARTLECTVARSAPSLLVSPHTTQVLATRTSRMGRARSAPVPRQPQQCQEPESGCPFAGFAQPAPSGGFVPRRLRARELAAPERTSVSGGDELLEAPVLERRSAASAFVARR